MQHRKVIFHRICMCCDEEYGVKYDYPPNEWNGYDKLLTHGLCEKCNKKYREENKLKGKEVKV